MERLDHYSLLKLADGLGIGLSEQLVSQKPLHYEQGRADVIVRDRQIGEAQRDQRDPPSTGARSPGRA